MCPILHLCKIYEPRPIQTGDEGMETPLFSLAKTIPFSKGQNSKAEAANTSVNQQPSAKVHHWGTAITNEVWGIPILGPSMMMRNMEILIIWKCGGAKKCCWSLTEYQWWSSDKKKKKVHFLLHLTQDKVWKYSKASKSSLLKLCTQWHPRFPS